MFARASLSLAVVAVLLLTGCTAQPGPEETGGTPSVLTVPAQHPTISAAVAAAEEGDTILVSAGVYRETVVIDTPSITLRGQDRDGVVIDGEVRRGNGVVVAAPGVTVQNLTVTRATQNGVLVTGMSDDGGTPVGGHDGYRATDPGDFPLLDGFRVDHVTASNNGLYGIYAFNASNGVITDSYASGGADSGIYVGQCDRCNIVIRGNVAERNAVGFEIANAGGDLLVVGNRFAGNRVGATVATDYQEAYVPQKAATLAGNLIAANAQADTPELAEGGFGIGIGIAGGTENLIAANRIEAHPGTGVIVTSAEDRGPIGNRISGNVFADNGTDAAYTPSTRAPGTDNCWEGESLVRTLPEGLAQASPCTAPAPVASGVLEPMSAPPGIPFSEVIAPPAQPDLGPLDGLADPWRGTASMPTIDLAAIAVPSATLLEENSAIRW